ncbi:MAG: serine hydrolase domain-containing protein [Pseudoclavibacter sp.]
MRLGLRTPLAPNPERFGRFARALAAIATVCVLVVVLAACTSRPAPLEDPPPVPSETATFETDAIEAAMDAMLTAGAPAVLVEVRDGDEVWRHALGVTTVTGSERPDPLAQVRIASVTKSMIGTILLQLEAEGDLDLDEPIETYLPDLLLGREVVAADGADGADDEGGTDSGGATDGEGDDASPGATGASGPELSLEPEPEPTGPEWTAPADPESQVPNEVPDGATLGTDVTFDGEGEPILDPTSTVTARMLAQHVAGLPDYINTFPLKDFAELPSTLAGDYSLEELIGRVAAQPWTAPPGAGFSYSNTNYLVLSLLIEQITGDPIDEVFDERIADRGNLEVTSLPSEAELPEGGAHGYFELDGVYIDVSKQSGSLWSGAGGVVSTVGDVNSFYRGLMQGAYLHAGELHEALDLNDAGYGIGIQGHADPCPAGDPVYATVPPEAGGGADDGDTDDGGTPGAPDASSGGAETPGSTGEAGETGETGEPGEAGVSDESGAHGDSRDAEPGPVVDGASGDRPAVAAAPTSSTDAPTPSDPGLPPTPTAIERFEIGEPGMTYGHLGSGLGYRILSMSSPDGERQVTVSWTASPVDYGADPRIEPAWQAVDAALMATCPRA